MVEKEDLEKKTVKDLRRFIVDNKIFKGIANLKKEQLVSDIIASKWWKEHKGQSHSIKAPEVKVEKEPPKEEKKRAMAVVKQEPIDIEPIKKEKKARASKLSIPTITLVPRHPPEVEAMIERAREAVEEAPKVEEAREAIPLPLEMTPKVEEERGKISPPHLEEKKEEIPSVMANPPIGRLTEYHDQPHRVVDVGSTIVNVYCNGSPHPDFPIPQSVVRHALRAQQMPLAEQQQLAAMLSKYQEQNEPPIIEGIPKEAIPQEVPHISHTKLSSAHKFPSVITRSRKNASEMAAPLSELEEKNEPQETDLEKRIRAQKVAQSAELAKLSEVSGKIAHNPIFRSSLEGMISKGRIMRAPAE